MEDAFHVSNVFLQLLYPQAALPYDLNSHLELHRQHGTAQHSRAGDTDAV
jgi:hypothetical protein